MGTSPISPTSLAQSAKSFWGRPEGKVGITFLAVVFGGVFLYTWSKILGWLISMLADTIHLAMLAGILVAIIFVLTNWRTHLAFRLLMRWITGLFITIDPIGVLKDHLVEMKKRRDVMNDQISNVRGAKQRLEDVIAKNTQTAEQNMRLAEQAKKMAQTSDADQKLRMELQTRLKANQAGRLQQSNVGYQQLLTKITTLYSLLTKWSTNVDFFIADTEDTVQQAEIQYKTINSAYGAFRKALAVFKGSAEENDLYDSTLENLAEQASMKLGEMEDFQRVAQNFMDTIDVQNGAVETGALAALDKYEQKVLTVGNPDTAFLLPGAGGPMKEPVGIQKQSTADTKYGGYFDKK